MACRPASTCSTLSRCYAAGMKTTYKIALAASLVLQISVSLAAQSLADIAREARAKRQAVSGARVILSVSQTEQRREPEYRREIQGLMARNAFAELDAAADTGLIQKRRYLSKSRNDRFAVSIVGTSLI